MIHISQRYEPPNSSDDDRASVDAFHTDRIARWIAVPRLSRGKAA